MKNNNKIRDFLINGTMVLYDFDDTLCVHNSRISVSNEIFLLDVMTKGVFTGWEYMNSQLQKFISFCKTANIRQGLISACSSFVEMKAKEEWVSEHYDVKLENMCVSRPSEKVHMLNIISMSNNVAKNKIMIVDDNWENLRDAAEAGFIACSPIEIVNFINSLIED